MGLIILLLIIGLSLLAWHFYKRKYGVWLLDETNLTRLGIAKKDVFGNRIAKYSFHIFEGYQCWVELKENGMVGTQKKNWNSDKNIVKWKDYK